MPAATVISVKNRVFVSLVLLVLAFAPAIPALASLCGLHGCEMVHEDGGCTHAKLAEPSSTEHEGMEEMDCCPSSETGISSATITSDDCCPTVDASTSDAPARLQAETTGLEAPELHASVYETLTSATEPIARTHEPLPPPPELFTLHSAFLI